MTIHIMMKSCQLFGNDLNKNQKIGGSSTRYLFPLCISRKTLHNILLFVQALGLIEALLRLGSKRCVDEIKAHIFRLKVLQSFSYIDDDSTDKGVNGLFSFSQNVKDYC